MVVASVAAWIGVVVDLQACAFQGQKQQEDCQRVCSHSFLLRSHRCSKTVCLRDHQETTRAQMWTDVLCRQQRRTPAGRNLLQDLPEAIQERVVLAADVGTRARIACVNQHWKGVVGRVMDATPMEEEAREHARLLNEIVERWRAADARVKDCDRRIAEACTSLCTKLGGEGDDNKIVHAFLDAVDEDRHHELLEDVQTWSDLVGEFGQTPMREAAWQGGIVATHPADVVAVQYGLDPGRLQAFVEALAPVSPLLFRIDTWFDDDPVYAALARADDAECSRVLHLIQQLLQLPSTPTNELRAVRMLRQERIQRLEAFQQVQKRLTSIRAHAFSLLPNTSLGWAWLRSQYGNLQALLDPDWPIMQPELMPPKPKKMQR
jgi:hypothetical protein